MRQTPGGRLCFVLPDRSLDLRALTPGVRRALEILADGGAPEGVLSDRVIERDGARALPLWYYCLDTLRESRALCSVLRQGGKTLARLTHPSWPLDGSGPAFARGSRYRVSRFAYLRREGEQLLLVSPFSGASLELTDRRALAMVGALCRPVTLRQLTQAARGIAVGTARAFVTLLSTAGMLEDAERGATQWDFGDVVFHASSRSVDRFNVAGRGFGSPRRPPSPPAVKPSMSAHAVALHRPDVGALKAHDVPFTSVLEQRRSVRSYGTVPMSGDELGEFLFRVARVKKRVRSRQRAGLPELTSRPYPSGGACYGLELYVVIGSCRGIRPGVYHYHPLRHCLESLAASPAHADRLLDDARRARGGTDAPQVLVVVTARFRRVAWKYQTVAYALILKEVGVLYQTMYLVATAMKLAPCALGAGDSKLFARVIGTDFYEETSVGEFLLGSSSHTNSGRP